MKAGLTKIIFAVLGAAAIAVPALFLADAGRSPSAVKRAELAAAAIQAAR